MQRTPAAHGDVPANRVGRTMGSRLTLEERYHGACYRQPTAQRTLEQGILTGQMPPLKLQEIQAIRIRLQMADRVRDLAIDSKLRACDLVKLRGHDVCSGSGVASRARVIQQKAGRPVQFEITKPTRNAILAWIDKANLTGFVIGAAVTAVRAPACC